MRAGAVLRTVWGRAALALLAVVAAALVVAAATGGLRTITSEQPTSAPGEVIDTGQVEVTVVEHVVTDRIYETILESVPGADAWLVLRVRALAVSDATVSALPAVVTPDVAVGEGYGEPDIILARDGSRGSQLHPGMAEDLLLLWPVRAADVPELLVVEVTPQERFWSALQDTWTWQDGAAPVRLEVPAGEPLPADVVAMLS